MAPVVKPVQTSADVPPQTTVVIIGAGIVGLSAALTLAERGIPHLVLDKGRIAAEQSSRNLGWVRKTNRGPADLPLAIAAEQLWQQMAQRTGAQVGYHQGGIMFVARTKAELAASRSWLDAIRAFGLDSRLLRHAEIDALIPGGRERWAGSIDVTPDPLPVISPGARIRGLTLATGFSGHGFGTGPAAGQLAADLAMDRTPLVNPAPYRLERLI